MNKERKDELFQKVSIAAIQNGLFAQMDGNLVKTLLVIASFQDENGICYPSQDTIAELCGVKRETINRQIKKLINFRTKEGHAVIEKTTIRHGREKTRTYYRILPASGIFFGKNKVVTETSQPIKEVVTETSQPIESEPMKNVKHVAQCEDNSKVVTKSSQGVVTNHIEGCDRNVTLTRTINNNHSNNIQNRTITNNIKSAAIVDKENNSLLKDNNKVQDNNSFVAKNKDSKETKDLAKYNQGNIVENQSEKISDKKKRKGTARGGAGASSLSLEQIVRMRAAEAEELQERKRAAFVEEQKRKEAAYYGHRRPYSPDMASKDVSKGKRRPNIEIKPVKRQNDPFDDLSFEDILAMSDEEFRTINV